MTSRDRSGVSRLAPRSKPIKIRQLAIALNPASRKAFNPSQRARLHSLLTGVERATMRTIHLLVILLALTARNAAAVAMRISTKDRLAGTYSLLENR